MFGPWMTKSNLLGWICSTCINDYVDYANGTCDFNNASFKALLEWCSEMNPDYEGEVMRRATRHTVRMRRCCI